MVAAVQNEIIQAQSALTLTDSPAAAERLFQGSMAFVNAAGFTTKATAAGVNIFKGIVRGEVDNSAGAAGDKMVETHSSGVFELSGTGFAQTSVGQKVYAEDDSTLTLTATANSLVGTVAKFYSSTRVGVDIDVQAP